MALLKCLFNLNSYIYREHEAAIRQYQGPDPLDPWFNYIQWVEQSYPKHGHEGNIDKLIKDCLQLFEKDERYFQDRRLIKLWIKYVSCYSYLLNFKNMNWLLLFCHQYISIE